jgi:hypothetical protein
MSLKGERTSGLTRVPGRLPPRQEVERKGNGLVERQETLLAVYRTSKDSLYTVTREAVSSTQASHKRR